MGASDMSLRSSGVSGGAPAGFSQLEEARAMLNQKSVKVLNQRRAELAEKLRQLNNQLNPIHKRIMNCHPTVISPFDLFIFEKLSKDFKEILQEGDVLLREKSPDLKVKDTPAKRKLEATIRALDSLVAAAKSPVLSRKELSSYWIYHMQHEIDYDHPKETAKHFMDASYKFLKKIIHQQTALAYTIPEAVKARDQDIKTLIFDATASDASKRQKLKKIKFFMAVAETCLKKDDPHTAQAILAALPSNSPENLKAYGQKDQYVSLMPILTRLREQAAEQIAPLEQQEKTKIESNKRHIQQEKMKWSDDMKIIGKKIAHLSQALGPLKAHEHLSTHEQTSVLDHAKLESLSVQYMLDKLSATCDQDKDDTGLYLFKQRMLKTAQKALDKATVSVPAPMQELPAEEAKILHKVESLFKEFDKTLFTLHAINQTEKPVGAFDGCHQACRQQLSAIAAQLRVLPPDSLALKKLEMRHEMGEWLVAREEITQHLQAIKEQPQDLRNNRLNLERVNALLAHLVKTKDIDRYDSIFPDSQLKEFKNEIYNSLLMEKEKIERAFFGSS